MIIIDLILEENKRLHALIPIYDSKIIGSIDDVQRSRFEMMKRQVEKAIIELKPFVDLANKEK